MGKSAAMRASRSSRQSSAAIEIAVPVLPAPHTNVQDTRTIQQLRDELEELTEAKERADHRVTQLEERAQYLEANARLSASMASKENMDLKEKARKLEIELSTVVDERDTLALEIVGDSAVLDEARLLSSQLKEAWLRISTMRQSQEEHVQKLYKAQESNAKLVDDLAKATDASTAAKTALHDQKTRWETEKAEFLAEIESLKTKLASSSKDGGKQVLDWEQDRTRLRDSLKNERAAWDKEKRGFMDQIASLKVKATSLSLQKTAPPEWTLEKHQLVDQCTTLQSRVAALESDRSSTGGPSSPAVKKLELEKLKLEKKVDALKAKLVEVMDHFRTTQAQADEKKASPSFKPGRRPAAPRKPASKPNADDAAMDTDTDTEEKTDAPLAPPPRSQRVKRATTTKPISYHVSSTSDDDGDDGSEDDKDDDDDDDDDDEDNNDNESAEDEEMQDAAHNTTEVSGTESVAGRPSKPPSASASASEMTSPGSHSQEPVREKGAPAGSPVRPSAKKSSAAKIQMNEEDSDSDFEPEPELIKNRGRGAVKRAASPAATEPSAKKASASTSNKKRSTPTEQTTVSVTSSATSSAPMDSLASSNTPTEATPGTPSEAMTAASAVAAKDMPPATTTTATTSTTASTTAVTVTADKVKKKRKLLTGKGLQELGDILNGPGSELSSAPGTGLHFGANKARAQASSSGSLLNGTKPSQPKLQALNAIKMAFALPKARNSSPSGDMES
ncbi:hypothetical protein KVV02_007711 [Mortierella alpina]|uniref:Uncharacterized protein n=1 Tax=Mortierella alpina TaxID=64518 RepID=A0A9P7ZY25_MORAP|nr:hypothetical protein KVV02_007711 [Mortierella alpina]